MKASGSYLRCWGKDRLGLAFSHIRHSVRHHSRRLQHKISFGSNIRESATLIIHCQGGKTTQKCNMNNIFIIKATLMMQRLYEYLNIKQDKNRSQGTFLQY